MTQAKDNLDNALINVARCAQELVDNNKHRSFELRSADYPVSEDDFKSLQTACDSWKEATQSFLVEVSKPAYVRKPKTLEQMANDALNVQSAVNLSGIVHSFSLIMTDLRDILEKEENFSTTMLNEHPICILFSDKIASLTGSENSSAFGTAYNWAQEVIRK